MKLKYKLFLSILALSCLGSTANATSINECRKTSFSSVNFNQQILNIVGAPDAEKGHLCAKTNIAYQHALNMTKYPLYDASWYHELYYCTKWLKYESANWAAHYSKAQHQWIKTPTGWSVSWPNNWGMYNYVKFVNTNANTACLSR